MEMQSNCDLELRLFPSDSDFQSSSVEESSSPENQQTKQESQIITILYNGDICVSSDLTHLQANAILSLASRDMEERRTVSLRSSDGSDTPIIQNNRVHQYQRASIKRSLRSFLQKRNVRIQATSPYYHSR